MDPVGGPCGRKFVDPVGAVGGPCGLVDQVGGPCGP